MAKVNENIESMGGRYLFSEIAARVGTFTAAHPGVPLIRMGIGDVTRPLSPVVIRAMHAAVEDCAHAESFRGYGPEHGYDFLREAIVRHDYIGQGIDTDEVFISDGAKSDTGNFGDLLSQDNLIGIPDPVYPVYVDTNHIAGRQIRYIPCRESNGFTGDIPSERLDVVWLCYPNNPTGAIISREKLSRWVQYALENESLILYDSTYEAFIRDADIPHSIYEIPGAKSCAVEFRSFSKTAGFTGIRCGYTVVPKELEVRSADGRKVALNPLWERRQSCKFNGASYISQRGAEAIYTPQGRQEIRAIIDGYLDTASLIRRTFQELGLTPCGGDNSPYIWARTPQGMSSWEFFDFLLARAGVVITPGAGFGAEGEGWFRTSAFASREAAAEAMNRIKEALQ